MPSKTELFLDDELIEMTAGVTRRIHQPTKHRLNPVLRPEHWWEGNHVMPLATLYDPEEKLFKMWYRTDHLDHAEGASEGAAPPLMFHFSWGQHLSLLPLFTASPKHPPHQCHGGEGCYNRPPGIGPSPDNLR